MRTEVIHYTTDEINEISGHLQKKIGYEPSCVQIVDVLMHCSRSVFPGFEVEGTSVLNDPFRLQFKMGRMSEKNVN